MRSLTIRRLREVPGIGVIGAYTILTETNDMRRFPSPGQYLSYCWLVPGAANSGGKSRQWFGNKPVKSLSDYPADVWTPLSRSAEDSAQVGQSVMIEKGTGSNDQNSSQRVVTR